MTDTDTYGEPVTEWAVLCEYGDKSDLFSGPGWSEARAREFIEKSEQSRHFRDHHKHTVVTRTVPAWTRVPAAEDGQR